VLVALGFRATPATLARDESDLQTTGIDALWIGRWRHDNVSDVLVTRLPRTP
jgi:hypothetical protein